MSLGENVKHQVYFPSSAFLLLSFKPFFCWNNFRNQEGYLNKPDSFAEVTSVLLGGKMSAVQGLRGLSEVVARCCSQVTRAEWQGAGRLGSGDRPSCAELVLWLQYTRVSSSPCDLIMSSYWLLENAGQLQQRLSIFIPVFFQRAQGGGHYILTANLQGRSGRKRTVDHEHLVTFMAEQGFKLEYPISYFNTNHFSRHCSLSADQHSLPLVACTSAGSLAE